MGSEGNVVKSVKLKTVDGIELCDIPEWLLVEVLIRLPVRLVFRSKLVSKQWLSVISNLISCERHRHGIRHNVFGVSNGLVLYGSRLLDIRTHSYFDRYNICNPIARQWFNLSPDAATYLIDDDVSRGFLTRVENNILTSYRIVCIKQGLQKSKMNKLDVFISEIGEWKDFTVCIDGEIEVIWFRKPTALNGILHWITFDLGIIAYDPYYKPDCLRFIALPGDLGLRWIDEISMGMYSLPDVHQGQMRYFESFESSTHRHSFSGFGVWLLNDYSTGDWSLQHRINYADILYDNILFDRRLDLKPISFHPFDSDIVYLGNKDIITSCNMKTRKLVDHGSLLDVEDIIGQMGCITYEDRPKWLLSFLLMIPPWPIYIPVPSFGVVKD